MDLTQQDFCEMMTRREGSPYLSSSSFTLLDEEEPFNPGDLPHDEYFNMREICSDEYPIPQAVIQPGFQQSFDVDPQMTKSNTSIKGYDIGPIKQKSSNKSLNQTFSQSLSSFIQ
ncbi:hypothetical protein O181_034711 [Austropuccinia psidii MF-1]|uniref:Uncharacterized protein n=1 Tax=Austropuccinia psidii MF-1 TaxID=1389203 RepID=A0A9Q3H8A5_9BASI|nr:hypothetical protein [Austropuccinia psidii MF-1]